MIQRCVFCPKHLSVSWRPLLTGNPYPLSFWHQTVSAIWGMKGRALILPLMPSWHFFQSCGMRKMWPSFYNTEDLVAFPIWFGNQTLPWMRSLLFCVAAKWSVESSRRWLLTIMTASLRVGPPPPILATYNVGDTRRAPSIQPLSLALLSHCWALCFVTRWSPCGIHIQPWHPLLWFWYSQEK